MKPNLAFLNVIAHGSEFLMGVMIDVYENGPYVGVWDDYNITDSADRKIILNGVKLLRADADYWVNEATQEAYARAYNELTLLEQYN